MHSPLSLSGWAEKHCIMLYPWHELIVTKEECLNQMCITGLWGVYLPELIPATVFLLSLALFILPMDLIPHSGWGELSSHPNGATLGFFERLFFQMLFIKTQIPQRKFQ